MKEIISRIKLPSSGSVTHISLFFCRYNLEISIEDMKAIFDPVVDKIIHLIREQLKAAPQCDFVFLVGGFAQSPYLTERVKAAFPDRSNKILSPPEPGECDSASILEESVQLHYP
jgi:molecular chaperone DnaK (HSP70)